MEITDMVKVTMIVAAWSILWYGVGLSIATSQTLATVVSHFTVGAFIG